MLPVDVAEDLFDTVLCAVSTFEDVGLCELDPLEPDTDTLGDLFAMPLLFVIALGEELELDELDLLFCVAERVVADTLGI